MNGGAAMSTILMPSPSKLGSSAPWASRRETITARFGPAPTVVKPLW